MAFGAGYFLANFLPSALPNGNVNSWLLAPLLRSTRMGLCSGIRVEPFDSEDKKVAKTCWHPLTAPGKR